MLCRQSPWIEASTVANREHDPQRVTARFHSTKRRWGWIHGGGTVGDEDSMPLASEERKSDASKSHSAKIVQGTGVTLDAKGLVSMKALIIGSGMQLGFSENEMVRLRNRDVQSNPITFAFYRALHTPHSSSRQAACKTRESSGCPSGLRYRTWQVKFVTGQSSRNQLGQPQPGKVRDEGRQERRSPVGALLQDLSILDNSDLIGANNGAARREASHVRQAGGTLGAPSKRLPGGRRWREGRVLTSGDGRRQWLCALR